MLFRKQHHFDAMMAFNIRVLTALGFWGESGIELRATLQYLAYTTWFIPPGVLFCVRQQPSSKLMLKSVYELVAAGSYIVRIGNLYVFNGTLQKAFNEVQFALGELSRDSSDAVRKVLNHLTISADYICKGYGGTLIIQCLLFGPAQGLVSILKYFVWGEDPKYSLLEADYLIYNQYSNFNVWLLTMLASTCALYVLVFALLSHETFYWNILHHVSCLFKIIRLKILELDDCSTPKQFQEQLSIVVEMHERAFKSTRLLEQAISAMMSFLYLSFITIMCSMLLVFTVIQPDLGFQLMMSVALQYNVFLIFTFSMLGTELTEASLSVSDAVYSIRWYEKSPAERRLLLFVQMRAQKQAAITAAKFFYLTRASFATAIKKTFSYFTVILQFYG
ncbi:hypothetical protein quinque_013127 [Culex quinquefasciatus]